MSLTVKLTEAERLRRLRTFEERRKSRVESDLDKRDAMIIEAHKAKVSVTKIAEAAGMTRTNVYDILNGDRSARSRK